MTAVQVAFGVDPFDDTTLDVDANWVDVLENGDVRAGRYETDHRSDRFGGFVPGKATFTFNNRGRRYDSSHATGPFAGNLRRNTPIRVVDTHAGVAYTQWYGYVREWLPSYRSGVDSVTTVRAVTGTGLLAQYDLAPITAAHAGDTAGARIGRVLDDWGFPSAYRELDAGPTLGSTTFGVNGLAHAQQAALSAGGLFYADRDGTLVFDSQAGLTQTRQTTSQVTLSHDPAVEPHYLMDSLQMTGVGLGYKDLVRITGATGNVQTVDNSAANEAPTSLQRTLLMASDHAASGLADYLADLYGTEQSYPKSVKVLVSGIDHQVAGLFDESVLHLVVDGHATPRKPYRTEVLARRLRDRVTVTADPPGGGANISHQVFIDGMAGELDARTGTHTITYSFESADAYDSNLASASSTWFVWDTDLWDTGKWGYV